MKKNPRREVTPEEQSQIRAMTLRGDSQILISRTLKIGRDTVGAWQVKLGVSAPVVPIPEAEILKLAKAGHGVYKIRAVTGVSVKKISAIVNKHGIIHPGRNLTPEKRAKIDREIRSKKFYLASIARRNRVTEQTVQVRAHKIFGRGKFRPGVSWPPLSSDFPQTNLYTEGMNAAEYATVLMESFGLDLRSRADAKTIAAVLTYAAIEKTPALRDAPQPAKGLYTVQLLEAFETQLLANINAAPSAPRPWVN